MSQASPAGNPSPAPSSGGASNPQTQQQGGPSSASQGGESQDFDYKGAFQRTNSELTRAKQGMHRLSSDFGKLKETAGQHDQTITRLREALGADAGKSKEPTRTEQLEAEIDQTLEMALRYEKEGKGIPLTTKALLGSLEARLQLEKMNAALEERLAKLEGKTNKLDNPDYVINSQAFTNMDGFVQKTLKSIYGPGQETGQVRDSQFKAITDHIGGYLKILMQKKPAEWDRVRRDPDAQRDICQEFIKRNLPPKAVEIMEKEHLSKTPQSTKELQLAFKQAANIKDPKERESVRASIRQDILGRMFSKGRRSAE